MALWDRVSQFLALQPVQDPPTEMRTLAEGSVSDLAQRIFGVRGSPWRIPTISEALSVPAIQRACSLISSTTGMLSVQGYRSGALLEETPRLLQRPDPFHTPGEFYSGTAFSLASRGEFVWWIASRDGDGMTQALVRVPLAELHVEDNPRNRLFPIYTWEGQDVRVVGQRFSAANPSGVFVHVMYPLAEPFALRGRGPLQLCDAATSVTVEAQEWAANFYSQGGHPSDIIKHAAYLDATLKDEFGNADPEGMSEADRLRAQYVARDSNTPLIIDQAIESVTAGTIDTAGAQMLEARQHQNGDAARMFGIPGSLLEYQQPGASLTYQNLEGEFTKFVKACLQPLYLEPIEQALSDLLPRATVGRFNVKGFLRADIKTRFEVHGLAIDKGIYDAPYAQREEGIAPGDVEFAPVLASPPQSIPAALPEQTRAAMREIRCPKCNRLVTKGNGDIDAQCPRCRHTFFSAGVEVRSAPESRAEIHVHLSDGMVRVETPVTVTPPNVTIEPAQVTLNTSPTTVQVTMPDAEARIADLGVDIKAVATGLEGLMVRQELAHDESQTRLAEVASANRDVAKQLGESLKPRKIVPIRDKGQIVGMTSEVA